MIVSVIFFERKIMHYSPAHSYKLVLVVPCFNEEQMLTVSRSTPPPHCVSDNIVADNKQRQITNLFINEVDKCTFRSNVTVSFVFVDDGSKDGTLKCLRELADANDDVHYVSFSRNFGKESALYAGLVKALSLGADYVATMDVDLQDPPSLLPEMLDIAMQGEYDTVATRRVTRKGEPPIRSFFARCFYKLINKISDTQIVDGARDYRMMPRRMVEALVSMKEVNRFSKGLFSWVGFKTKWLEYENIERAAGETKWSFWKLFKYSVDGIVSFSTMPLSISTVAGFFVCLAALAYLVFIVVKTLAFGEPEAGYPSMMCVILFLGGVQLICIGIVGQYLAKSYLETKHRPIFITKEEK